MILLGTGWTVEEASTALLLDQETLRNYAKKFKEGGIQELLQNNCLGRQSLLNKAQKSLRKHVKV